MVTRTASKSSTSRTASKTRRVTGKRLSVAVKKLTPIAKTVAAKPFLKKKDIQATTNVQATPVTKPVIKKVKKTKLVRDSFTMPKDEYLALPKLKERAVQQGKTVKKGELLRAGLLALTSMSDSAFLVTISAIPALKTGRPKSAKNSNK